MEFRTLKIPRGLGCWEDFSKWKITFFPFFSLGKSWSFSPSIFFDKILRAWGKRGVGPENGHFRGSQNLPPRRTLEKMFWGKPIGTFFKFLISGDRSLGKKWICRFACTLGHFLRKSTKAVKNFQVKIWSTLYFSGFDFYFAKIGWPEFCENGWTGLRQNIFWWEKFRFFAREMKLGWQSLFYFKMAKLKYFPLGIDHFFWYIYIYIILGSQHTSSSRLQTPDLQTPLRQRFFKVPDFRRARGSWNMPV